MYLAPGAVHARHTPLAPTPAFALLYMLLLLTLSAFLCCSSSSSSYSLSLSLSLSTFPFPFSFPTSMSHSHVFHVDLLRTHALRISRISRIRIFTARLLSKYTLLQTSTLRS
ncbi:hypothetical protein B0H15DRAFT_496325 [Mycena belliarum]|uniref:Uncharacterized protein n=1 Tax=Mycena belliarum TaxID=1033014 RepID=A0AAD6XJW4_9AGAR|nr:hypothetical protein B0H15DRAFT_496325 [Mycena belliae]